MLTWLQQRNQLRTENQQLFYLLQLNSANIMISVAPQPSPQVLSSHPNPIQQLSTLLQADLDELASIVSSSIQALRRLTHDSLLASPCHKLLSLSVRNINPPQSCSSVGARVMRELLRKAVTNSRPPNEQSQAIGKKKGHQNEHRLFLATVFSSENFKEILRKQFTKIMDAVMTSFRDIFFAQERISNIQFSWKEEACEKIWRESIGKVLSCKNFQQICGLGQQGCQLTGLDWTSRVEEDMQVSYYKGLLLRLQGSQIVKQQIYQLFADKCVSQAVKQRELRKWMECTNELKSTVMLQMKQLQEEEAKNKSFQAEISELNFKLYQTSSRLVYLQTQMLRLEQDFNELKQPIIVQKPQETYYINPLYEKSQVEEKLFMEMIEIESELLIGKEQIKLMTEGIVDILKLARSSIEDLQASQYHISSFGKAALRILKDVKSLDSIDLEALLTLKEDSHSLFDSEYFEETRKSELSTFSEIEMQQKMSRLTEDDSIYLSSNDQ